MQSSSRAEGQQDLQTSSPEFFWAGAANAARHTLRGVCRADKGKARGQGARSNRGTPALSGGGQGEAKIFSAAPPQAAASLGVKAPWRAAAGGKFLRLTSPPRRMKRRGKKNSRVLHNHKSGGGERRRALLLAGGGSKAPRGCGVGVRVEESSSRPQQGRGVRARQH